MGLHLDDEMILLSSDEELEALLQPADDILLEVRAKLKHHYNIGPYPKPSTVPVDLADGLADSIAKMTDDHLSVLLAQYIAYASFLSDKVAETGATYRIASTNRDRVKKLLTLRFRRDSKVAKTDVDAYVAVHSVYIRVEDEADKLYAMKEILEARYKSYSKQAATLSRLIEIRTGELNTQSSRPGVGQGGGRPNFKQPGRPGGRVVR